MSKCWKELDDYDNARDDSVLDDIARQIQDDYDNDVITEENYDALIAQIQQEKDEVERSRRDTDYPSENMDEDDTPFGTSD